MQRADFYGLGEVKNEHQDDNSKKSDCEGEDFNGFVLHDNQMKTFKINVLLGGA